MSGARSRRDFEVYGNIAVDSPSEDGFERVNTFLIWKDGKLMLAGSPGGRLLRGISYSTAAVRMPFAECPTSV